MKAVLLLQDGHSFTGETIADVQGEKIGEVVLNTAVVGYQEMSTDPANAGKILVLTYPLIGNYGVAPKFNESAKAWLCGLVIKEKSNIFSNWQAKDSLDNFVKKQELLTLCGIDTRTLAVHLRQKGEILGIISTVNSQPKELLAKLASHNKTAPRSLLAEISVKKIMPLDKTKGRRIAILDLGITNSIIRQLKALGFSLTLLPYNTPAAEILRLKAQGLIISGGPESDPGLGEVVENIKSLVGKIPILGIACGHQVLAQSLGAKIIKLKLGHRGVNYPIHKPPSYKGEITVQNHSWVVDVDSLSKVKGMRITAYNLNDRTAEEMESRKHRMIGVQYNPASPGFNEPNEVFKKFLKMLERSK